jgi:cbb3-type cytochrome oxidase subunit 3
MSGLDYETVAKFAQQGGTLYFGAVFIAGVIYALWPKHARRSNASPIFRSKKTRTSMSERSATNTPASRRPATSGTASSELDNPLPRWWLWVFYGCIVVHRLLGADAGLAGAERLYAGMLETVRPRRRGRGPAGAAGDPRPRRGDAGHGVAAADRGDPALQAHAPCRSGSRLRRQLRHLPRRGRRREGLSQPARRRLAVGRRSRRSSTPCGSASGRVIPRPAPPRCRPSVVTTCSPPAQVSDLTEYVVPFPAARRTPRPWAGRSSSMPTTARPVIRRPARAIACGARPT